MTPQSGGTNTDWGELLSASTGERLAAVRARRIATLWAGCGHILELRASTAAGEERTFIVKDVRPPAQEGVSFERKVRSYQVEAFFYTHLAPQLLEGSPPGGTAGCAIPRPLHISSAPPISFTILLSDIRQRYPRPAPSSMSLAQTKVVLSWLAEFHAHFWGASATDARYAGLWPVGCYWHLATRQEELQAMPHGWQRLKDLAAAIDLRLQGYDQQGRWSGQHLTLCHGDCKNENIMMNASGERCCLYDFQYCGAGYGMKDVVYLLVSSTQGKVLADKESELLQHYHAAVCQALQRRGLAGESAAYTADVMQEHYELAMMDYVRFMAGWGWWGAAGFAQARCRALLDKWAPRLAGAVTS